MDAKLKAKMMEVSGDENHEGKVFLDGFKAAIELLRSNKYHAHYAHLCANWLEQHLEREVSSKTTSTDRGY